MAATKLFEFSFATLKNFANDPSSGQFIPLVMHETDGITPVTTDSFEMGSFDNSTGTQIASIIASPYGTSKGGTAKPDPANPYPVVDLMDIDHVKKVIVNGLNNVLVDDFSSYDYNTNEHKITATIPLDFNQWSTTGKGGKITDKASGKTYDNSPLAPADLPMLNVSSPFHIVQDLIFYPGGDESQPGQKETATLDGSLSFSIPKLTIQGHLEITVSHDKTITWERLGLNLNLAKLSLIAPDNMSFGDVAVEGNTNTIKIYQKVLIQIIQSIIDSPTGTESILNGLSGALNEDSNRNRLSDVLNEKFTDIVNDKLGKVNNEKLGHYSGPADGNRVDYYMFDRIRYSLNTPGTPWYVKTLLEDYKNPSLNPLKPEDLSIGSYTISEIGLTLNDIKLSNIVVAGLPNSTVPTSGMYLGPPLHIAMVVGAAAPYTSATATFSASYSGGNLNLGLTIAIQGAQLVTSINSSGPDADHVVITVNTLSFEVPAGGTLHLTLDDQSGMGAFVQKILNKPDVQNKIIAAINGAFKEHLTDISNELTSIAKSIFSKAIG